MVGEQDISGVTVGTLSDFRSYIHGPRAISVQTSTDGETYSFFAELSNLPSPVLEEASVQNHYLQTRARTARYVRIEVKSQRVNPPNHPAPRETCWLFIDEILID